MAASHKETLLARQLILWTEHKEIGSEMKSTVYVTPAPAPAFMPLICIDLWVRVISHDESNLLSLVFYIAWVYIVSCYYAITYRITRQHIIIWECSQVALDFPTTKHGKSKQSVDNFTKVMILQYPIGIL